MTTEQTQNIEYRTHPEYSHISIGSDYSVKNLNTGNILKPEGKGHGRVRISTVKGKGIRVGVTQLHLATFPEIHKAEQALKIETLLEQNKQKQAEALERRRLKTLNTEATKARLHAERVKALLPPTLLPNERIRQVRGVPEQYTELYSATTLGRIYSHPKDVPVIKDGKRIGTRFRKGKFMATDIYRHKNSPNPTIANNLSNRIHLACNQERIHKSVAQMVLSTFVGLKPSDTHIAWHIDGDPVNNEVTNLKWIDTQSEEYKEWSTQRQFLQELTE